MWIGCPFDRMPTVCLFGAVVGFFLFSFSFSFSFFLTAFPGVSYHISRSFLAIQVGLFCHEIGLFCHEIGLFCHEIGLF